MELSRTIALVAVVLGLVVASGYAAGEDLKQSTQKKEAHEKRKAHFERSCNKPLNSDTDFVLCRAAYRALVTTQK